MVEVAKGAAIMTTIMKKMKNRSFFSADSSREVGRQALPASSVRARGGINRYVDMTLFQEAGRAVTS